MFLFIINYYLVSSLLSDFFTNYSWAAIPKHSQKNQKHNQETSQVDALTPTLKSEAKMDLTIMALRLPLENRVDALTSQIPQSVQNLEALAFDSGQSLQLRWRALTMYARLQKSKGLKTVERALTSPEWFMRNAGVVALKNMPRAVAIQWSERLLQDKALVVRTAAVQNLFDLQAKDKTAVLWQEIQAPHNFQGQYSLWIRHHIARVLANFAGPGQEKQFAKLLRDEDARLHSWAILGLEKSVGKKMFADAQTSIERRQLWLDWLNQRSI